MAVKKSSAETALTLDKILADVAGLPAIKPNDEALRGITLDNLPESSENVETSLLIARYFIDTNRRLLEDSAVLDTVSKNLDQLDTKFKQLEAELP